LIVRWHASASHSAHGGPRIVEDLQFVGAAIPTIPPFQATPPPRLRGRERPPACFSPWRAARSSPARTSAGAEIVALFGAFQSPAGYADRLRRGAIAVLTGSVGRIVFRQLSALS